MATSLTYSLLLLCCLFAGALSLSSPSQHLHRSPAADVELPTAGHQQFGVVDSRNNGSGHGGHPDGSAPNLLQAPSHLRYVLMSRLGSHVGISPVDWITQLILQVLQSQQGIIPTDIPINLKENVLGLSLTLTRLTFARPLIKDVSPTHLSWQGKGVISGSVAVSATFPLAQLHAIVGEGSPEEAIDFGDVVLFVNATDQGLTLPCDDPSTGKAQVGTVTVDGLHLTSTSSDPMVTLLVNVLNANSQFINGLISGVVDKVSH